MVMEIMRGTSCVCLTWQQGPAHVDGAARAAPGWRGRLEHRRHPPNWALPQTPSPTRSRMEHPGWPARHASRAHGVLLDVWIDRDTF
jgi:hypothetical protein